MRRGDALGAVDDVPAQHSVILRVLYPTSALAPGAPYARHVHDDILPATIAREQAAEANAERDRRQLEDTLHHPWAWILAAFLLAIVPAGLLGGFGYWRFGREHPTGTAPEYVHEPPDDLAPALVPSLLAQHVVAGGDQMAATLFELVRRGRYKMTPVTREESTLLGLRHKEVDDVDLTRGDESIELSVVEKPIAAIFDKLTEAGPAALSHVAEDRQGHADGATGSGSTARSEAFESAVKNQARQRKFWSGQGMVMKWLAFVVFLLLGAGFLALGIAGLADPPLVRQDLILTAIGAALALNAVVVLLLPRIRVAQARAQAAGLGRGLGGLPPLSQRLPAAGRQARRHAPAVGELPGLRDHVRHRRARARGRQGRLPRRSPTPRSTPRPCTSRRSTRRASPRASAARSDRPRAAARAAEAAAARSAAVAAAPGSCADGRGGAPRAAGRGRRRPTPPLSAACWPATARAPSRTCRVAEQRYRESWEAAPPGGYGRLVGMLKAAILRGDASEAADYALGGARVRDRVADCRLCARARLPRRRRRRGGCGRGRRRWPPAARPSSGRPRR